MLLGQYTVRLTQKERLVVPAPLRRKLGKDAVIAKWYEGCLVLVSKANFSDLLQKLTGKIEIITEPVRDTDRFILGSSFELNVDSQGRFVVPGILREYSGISDEVVFLGLGNRIEIWDKQYWVEREAYIQKEASKFVERLVKTKD